MRRSLVGSACVADAFVTSNTIRLGSGKPIWYAYVEPFALCYSNSDVVVSSFVMKYADRQIPAELTKLTGGGDKDGDGIQEIRIAFSKDNLRTLFAGLPNGHNLVVVTFEADLSTGGRLASGTVSLEVVSNGSFTAATVAPNPLNPEAILTYTTTRTGFVRIELYDIQGRLVRRIVDEPGMTAGTHQATIDGRGAHGEKLASGVYYLRGKSSEGAFTQLIT